MVATTALAGPITAEQQYRAALEAVTTPAYRESSARSKQEVLWNLISQVPYDPLPSMLIGDFQTLRRLANRAYLGRSFSLDDDVREPRTKPFHTYGTVAKMRFVADGKHPFTGIFSTGAVGFVRASLAVGMPKYSPAASLKFLAEGAHPSKNMLMHQSLDMQASRDFFERAPTNRTIDPITFPNNLIMPLLKFWLSRVSNPIQVQLLDHLAEVTNDGTPVQTPVTPEVVYLYGTNEVRSLPAPTDDFRVTLADIMPGTVIYRMFGKPTLNDKQVYIGSITIESSFVASEFGDRILAFRHAWGSK